MDKFIKNATLLLTSLFCVVYFPLWWVQVACGLLAITVPAIIFIERISSWANADSETKKLIKAVWPAIKNFLSWLENRSYRVSLTIGIFVLLFEASNGSLLIASLEKINSPQYKDMILTVIGLGISYATAYYFLKKNKFAVAVLIVLTAMTVAKLFPENSFYTTGKEVFQETKTAVFGHSVSAEHLVKGRAYHFTVEGSQPTPWLQLPRAKTKYEVSAPNNNMIIVEYDNGQRHIIDSTHPSVPPYDGRFRFITAQREVIMLRTF